MVGPSHTGGLGHVREFRLYPKGKTKPAQGLKEKNDLMICLHFAKTC